MNRELSPTERVVQLTLSTIFTVSVAVFGLFLIGIGVIQWVDGEIAFLGAVALIIIGAVIAYFLGIRPLWNQFAPRR